MLPTFQKNEHFVSVCTEKMMDHQYWKSGTRNIYSNYMLDVLQINKKNYTLSTFRSSNRQNFEDSGKVLAVSLSEFDKSTIQFSSTRPRL